MNKLFLILFICCIVCVTVLCSAVLNFISYFEHDYIYSSALDIMSAKIVNSSPMTDINYGVHSTISVPVPALEYELENDEEPSYRVAKLDLSRNPAIGEILFTNETSYNPDPLTLLTAPYPITKSQPTFIRLGAKQKESPLVLILHTHGTEAYYPQIRSTTKTENIVAIGSLMADILNSQGVPTLHCDIMHDEASYLNSYNRSKETIIKYLEEYPSIQYVFDIHRDAVVDANGETFKVATNIDGVEIAQVMSVIGTDYKGGDHPNWQDNLNIAVKLQNLLNTDYPNIARPINIRSATFNAQYAPGSLLLEIGSSGNTLTEAKRAAVITAEKLAELILGSE